MKILVVMPGKIGDALFATSSVRLIATLNPEAEIHWVYGTPGLTDFVTKCLVNSDLPVSKYISRDCPYTYGEIYGWRWGSVDWKAEYPGYDLYYNLAITKFPELGCHLIEWIARGAGLVNKGDVLANPSLSFSLPPSTQANDLVLVHPWIPAPERQSKWLMYLKNEYRGYKVATIGLKEEPLIPNTRDLRGMDYATYIDYLRTAKLVVGLCSSSAVLSATFGTPTVMVHGEVHPMYGGIGRFGPFGVPRIDVVKPFVYDMDRIINDLLSLPTPTN